MPAPQALGSRLTRPRDALAEAAGFLMRFLSSDLYVCCIRRDAGRWEVSWANTPSGQLPILPPLSCGAGRKVLELAENKRTIHHHLARNLRTESRLAPRPDEGTAYEREYGSRLTLLLRHDDASPFAAVFFYARDDAHFDDMRPDFFEDLGRILTLSVGRRLDLATDTLTKTAGGLAHVGNNIMAIITQNLDLAAEILDAGHPLEVREALETAKKACWRMSQCLADLFELAKRPQVVDCLQGRQVLDLQTRDWQRR